MVERLTVCFVVFFAKGVEIINKTVFLARFLPVCGEQKARNGILRKERMLISSSLRLISVSDHDGK